MKLYTHYDCPFNCCCFWNCYCCHQINIDTNIGYKRECFCDFDELEKNAQTGDVYGISTAGHWAFGPVWGPCQRRPSPWSHVGIIYVKHDSYKEDLCEKFVEVIDANPDETLFAFEAALSGSMLSPLRPIVDNLYSRCLAGYLTLKPIKQEIRDRTPDLMQRFCEITNVLSEGTYEFNPCDCAGIVCDVWPCGCNCCGLEKEGSLKTEWDKEGVCTEYGIRVMDKLGYFDAHDSDTKVSKYLKKEISLMAPEEVTLNDIFSQIYLYDDTREMVICGSGCSIRSAAPAYMLEDNV